MSLLSIIVPCLNEAPCIQPFIEAVTAVGLPVEIAFIFFSGMQLFVVGILGSYLAKTYIETKKRPSYLIKERQ